MQKYFKIGEISKLYNIGPDSLRYYEELGILTPKRSDNNYRIYSLNDLWRLNVIRDLRALDFSMEQIKTYLTDRSIDSTEQMLQAELSALDQKIALLTMQRNNVKNRLQTLHDTRKRPIGLIEEKQFDSRNCHMIHSGYKIDAEMDMLIKQLLNKDEQNLYIIGNNRIGSLLTLEDVQKERYRKYTSVFIMDEHGPETIPAGNYLTLCYHGDCDQNAIYLPTLLRYAQEHGFTPIDPVLEILWVDIHQAENVAEHITELQLRYL